MNTISWASPTTPLPMEINPRMAFERLFGDGGSADERRAAGARGQEHPRRDRRRGAGAAARGWAPRDRARLGDYLDNVREIERRIQQTEAQQQRRGRR